ncbi:hypothetical protein FE634_13830 [Nocardioides dongxiaopingii]|uniref:hypothetical protein n=1 Tax=Nocardioides TaxID=1839 RepID=UPI0010C76F9C|nr:MULTISPECIES: hypothetical protein [Nocardioides]QCW51216.1 hypothetical protein FE634_13830 [Nocardioides sp. S-1144]
MPTDDDEAWKAIVDNYGDRPTVEDDAPPAAHRPDPAPEPTPPPRERASATWDDEYPDSDWSTDRFVPPVPPPVPTPSPDRHAAWIGVFGSPAILLICLVLQIRVPELVAYLLVAGFVGGFLYLVFTMTREPRDPDDDGAVL